MKPYVICHMCTTIDGRILGDRWPKLPGGKDSAELFESTADSFGIGAWLVGTTTMREFAGRSMKLKPARRRVERTDYVADPRPEGAGNDPEVVRGDRRCGEDQGRRRRENHRLAAVNGRR